MPTSANLDLGPCIIRAQARFAIRVVSTAVEALPVLPEVAVRVLGLEMSLRYDAQLFELGVSWGSGLSVLLEHGHVEVVEQEVLASQQFAVRSHQPIDLPLALEISFELGYIPVIFQLGVIIGPSFLVGLCPGITLFNFLGALSMLTRFLKPDLLEGHGVYQIAIGSAYGSIIGSQTPA